MAVIIDEIEDKNEDTAPLEEMVKPEPEPQQEEVDELPEKYRGKSIKDLVQMHQEAEKAIGKKGSEVGELRKIVDNYIQDNLSRAPQAAPQEEEEKVDWFADPDKAFEQRLNSHPKIKEAERATLDARRQAAVQRLKSEHPDMQDILQDSSFAEWIKASPVRQELFVRADQQYDADAANELFSTFKERKSMVSRTVEADQANRTEQVRQASTGSARGANTPSRKKKYRRADIMKLMNDDPDRYMAMQDEIMLAYAEKRVI